VCEYIYSTPAIEEANGVARRKKLKPAPFPKLEPIGGVALGSIECGVGYQGRHDLMLAVLDPGTTIAGVLTRSLSASAPVNWSRAKLPGGRVRAIVVNAGNANAFTGRDGDAVVQATAARAAQIVGCRAKEVFIASTGVIGRIFPAKIIPGKLAALYRRVRPDGWDAAAAAIMTTDTCPKGATRTALIGDTMVTINAIGKGTQMIAPDLGTTLNFVFTDAKIPAPVLQRILAHVADRSFNCITIDGDTSTSDTLFVCATGAAKHRRVSHAKDPHLRDFRRALAEICTALSHAIVRDTAGASRFVTLNVSGAASFKAARKIGRVIGASPLVKYALSNALDPCGRIIMAVGKAGERANRDRLGIDIGGVAVARDGATLHRYDVDAVTAHLNSDAVEINIDVGIGRGRATIWTSDRSLGYG
jgi:glutamate N-acetyltransferase/amino-acid N-acetyltransferase